MAEATARQLFHSSDVHKSDRRDSLAGRDVPLSPPRSRYTRRLRSSPTPASGSFARGHACRSNPRCTSGPHAAGCVARGQRRHLGPQESAPEKHSEHCTIAKPLLGPNIWCVQEGVRLEQRQRVAHAHSFGSEPFDSCNSGGKFRSEEAAVGSFNDELPDAVIRTLIETDPRSRPSRTTRHALTVAFVKPTRSSAVYQARNSSSPRLYARRVIGEETLSSTRDFSPAWSFRSF
jgi:hypothetical protein